MKEITEPDLLYKQYFYRTATNDTMKKDLRELVNQLLDIVKPHDGNIVVDIGSNDCTMLNFYDRKYNLVGFEPAKNIKFIDNGKNIKIINNYFNLKNFNENFQAKKATIVTSCAMFYDLENPLEFASDIKEILADDGVWCCQISYLDSMIRNNNFEDICHEHLSYYSLETFEFLLEKLGLKLFYAETNSVNGGSIRLYVCKKSNKYEREEYKKHLEFLRSKEKISNLLILKLIKTLKKLLTN